MSHSKTTHEEMAAQEKQSIEDALNWSMKQSVDGKRCPYCANQPQFDSKHKDGWLFEHLRKHHFAGMLKAHALGDINADVRELGNPMSLDPREELGLDINDDNARLDLLHVNPRDKKALESEGGRHYWAAPDKVGHWKNVGLEVVAGASEGENTDVDGNVHAREMVLMRIPGRREEQLKQMKADQVDNQMMARKEEAELNTEGTKRKAYDAARKRGYTSNQATNFANAIANKMEYDD